jgi:hypothetical protein
MSNVQRICVQCGAGNPVESRYCSHCGYDSQAALPVPRSNLPAVIGRAAVPVLIGAASLVARVGWKLLQNRLSQAATPPTIKVQQPSRPVKIEQPIVPQARPEALAPRRSKRTVHIRSSWAVNTNGVWQEGTSEHTIELDE